LGLEDISDGPPDPADVADADADEEISRDISPTSHEAPRIPDLTQQEDQVEMDDQADLTPPQGMSVVVDQFPSGNPGMPIPDKPRGPTVYESWQAASTDSPWAPFRSELDWKFARCVKMRGQSATTVTEMLEMPGVRESS
jgi:hypothetical protein